MKYILYLATIMQIIPSELTFRLLVRRFLHWFFGFVGRVLTRTTIIGMENIPAAGAHLLATNHVGLIDAPLVFVNIKRKDATALVAKKHQKNPILRMLINNAGGIWINRDEADTQAMRAALEHLRKGGILGIAPEGTRSQDGQLGHGKTGVAYLADRARVPIIPVGISGTENGVERVLTLQRPRFTIRIGKPFSIPPIDRRDRDACLERATDEIMAQIAVLLPEEQRGVYAGHSRVKEMEEQG